MSASETGSVQKQPVSANGARYREGQVESLLEIRPPKLDASATTPPARQLTGKDTSTCSKYTTNGLEKVVLFYQQCFYGDTVKNWDWRWKSIRLQALYAAL